MTLMACIAILAQVCKIEAVNVFELVSLMALTEI